MATFTGTSGADRMRGTTGDDTFRSSAGDDNISAGTGFDTYVLSLGRASFVVTSPKAGVLVFHSAPGGPPLNFGTDQVSNVESFQLVGPYSTLTVSFSEMMARYNAGYSHAASGGNDKLLGSYGNDTISGLGGNDTVEGSYGNDRLDGGAGTDLLRGGDGADVFVFNAGEGGRDRIEDFQLGVDHLELHAASGFPPAAMAGTDATGRAGTWVSWGPGADTVFLAGVTGASIDALLV